MPRGVITLTTDFGLSDHFVGTMKGVIWSICPEARLADISHEIAPQNILEGAMVLAQAYAFFPVGTIHLAVVDPGVGTDRRPIAARLGEHLFVGPDNGLFTPILEAVEEQGGRIAFFHANNPRYWLPKVSHTFHGRDVFAPVAAHLAKGVPLSEVGEEINDPVRLKWPLPEETKNGWQAHIVGIDRFGNLATDLPGAELGRVSGPVFRLRGREVRGLVRSYGERPAGELVALVNSAGLVEIAVVNGSAADVLEVKVGELVEVIID